MGVEHREERSPDIHETIDGIADTGNPRRLERGEDLSHNPCRGGTDQVADAENDGVQRLGIRHLY